MDLTRETDPEQLRRVALALEGQVKVLVRVLADKCEQLRKLTGHEDELQQTLDLIAELQQQANETNSSSPAPASKPRKAQRGHGPTAQPELPCVEQLVELDEADKLCPSCGGELRAWEGQFEESELVDVVDVQYRVVKVKRQKYRCDCGGCVEAADGGPERLAEGGRYSLAFGAKVATDKYLDHLPLERQARICKRHGLKVTSQTLWDQVDALARELGPVHDALLERMRQEPVIGIDTTSWPRLHKGKHLQTPWQMWAVTIPGAVHHSIRDDKSAESFNALLGDFQGKAIGDAASTHVAAVKNNDAIILACCWAHAQRKFRAVEDDFPEVHVARDKVRQLYDIDERAGDDLALRAKLRETESAEVVNELKAWLFANVPRHPKTTQVGNALRYPLKYWEHFTCFLTDARVPLDNNATERGLRGPVIGRKNHYGSKSERGTAAAAVMYSLLETAKLQGVDPAGYLVDAMRAIRRGEILLPGQLN